MSTKTQKSPVSKGETAGGSVFDSFTNKYALSKTLRFELVPQRKTAKNLKAVFEEDKKLAERYREAKEYFDTLHRLFVREAFAPERVSGVPLTAFFRAFSAFVGAKDAAEKMARRSAYDKERKNLLAEIGALFEETGDEWKARYETRDSERKGGKVKKVKFSSKGHEVLTDEAVLDILSETFPERADLFAAFTGFFTYFSKFNETRENFYKTDGTSTAAATRVVDNFEKFIRNKLLMETRYAPVREDIGLAADEMRALTDIEEFRTCFLQTGIDDYNATLGGRSETDHSVNKKLNEYRQKSGESVKYLAKLDRQILGERDAKEEVIVKDDADLHARLKAFAEENEAYSARMASIIRSALLDPNQGGFDHSKIYISQSAVNTISSKYFSHWSILKGTLAEKFGRKSKEGKELPPFISLSQVSDVLNERAKDTELKELFKPDILKHAAYSESAGCAENFFRILAEELDTRIEESDAALKALQGNAFWRSGELSAKRGRPQDEGAKQIKLITEYLNACRDTHRIIGYFATEYRREWKDPEEGSDAAFYNPYKEEYEKDIFFPLYNAARNYLTKNPGEEEKIKLNFQSGVLLTGWDKNKETEKLGIILRKDGAFHLAIMRRQFSDAFDEKKHPEAYDASEPSFQKMEYKLFPDPKRMIPKIAFAGGNKEDFDWSPEIQSIKDEYAKFQEEKKEDWSKTFDKKKTALLIAYYQACLEKGGYKDTFGMAWKKPEEYAGVGEFNDDIARQNYRISFVSVSAAYVNERVERGEMYLFQIRNKDFSSGASGAKNIHTLYFMHLFSEENLSRKPVSVQLSGNAEVFYREASLKPEKDMRGKEKTLAIPKYKRYTADKVFLHVPIKLNAGSDTARNANQFNKLINAEFIAPHAKKFNVIGIDRGEKHLAYYSVIDQKGAVITSGSLNEINGVNYRDLLDKKEKERLADRRSWLPVRQIKDLKRGFVSHAVKEICDLALEHNAIVVLENLNMRFKQVRGGIEKSIYQQLEKQLIEKLGYLVFKKRDALSPGGALNGYQLAAPFESFKDMRDQTGILFYTEAAYTSKTDPASGFRRNVYVGSASPKKKLEKAMRSFRAIGWDTAQRSYFFTYDPADFADEKRSKKSASKVWAVYANVPRIRRERGENGVWEARDVDPNDMLRQIFRSWGFKDLEMADMKEEIVHRLQDGSLKESKDIDGRKRGFLESVFYVFGLILEMRNSSDAADYIASPVEPFFTTLNAPKPNPAGVRLEHGDALGAYNIARKGLIVLERIRENPEKPDLYVSKEQWDEWAQKHKAARD